MRDDELAMISALNLAMTAVQKNNMIEVPSPIDECRYTLDKEIKKLEEEK